ncbi:FecR family protein [uncultured Bacteroides sp.]|uniref:FecR family protein n=1 Tax=uncultured Bacteroides sp. TaxID=162156 RepID=UPI00267584DD|nr:FecR domain-containing protein [uncultured Bacteroides sp.]
MDEIVLLSYLRGECNDTEAARVEAWCGESPENRKALEQLYYTLFVGDRVAVMNAVDTDASLEKFKSAVREKEKLARRKDLSIRWGRYAAMTAAFLTGLVVAGGITWGLVSNKLSDYTVATAAGQRAQTVLPDGSRVWLNASTRLVYRNSFWSTDRQIDLSGEAYFEVAQDRHAPFVVNSKQIKTRVLGTKFNVRAREEENRVVTTLLQGSVRMESPRTQDNGYLLKPGQTMNINTDTYQAELIEYAEPSEVLLWINGKLEFKQHSLLEITNIMEKLFDIEFVYEDVALKTERFTGQFSTDCTPDEILNVLMHTNHFNYKKEGRVVRLSKK